MTPVKDNLYYLSKLYELLIDLLDAYTSKPYIKYPYMDDVYLSIVTDMRAVHDDPSVQVLIGSDVSFYQSIEGDHDEIVIEWYYDRSSYREVQFRLKKLLHSYDDSGANGTSKEYDEVIKKYKSTIDFFIEQKSNRINDIESTVLGKLKLSPSTYDPETSILKFDKNHQYAIAKINKHGDSRHNLLKRIFSSSQSMANGVDFPFSAEAKRNSSTEQNERQTIRTQISTINNLARTVTGEESLLKTKKDKVFVNPVHL